MAIISWMSMIPRYGQDDIESKRTIYLVTLLVEVRCPSQQRRVSHETKIRRDPRPSVGAQDKSLQPLGNTMIPSWERIC
jgi:hypothetical protein